jgi:hypothetical protein
MLAGPTKIEGIVKNDSLNDMLIDIMSCDNKLTKHQIVTRGEVGFEVVPAHELSITSGRGRSPSAPRGRMMPVPSTAMHFIPLYWWFVEMQGSNRPDFAGLTSSSTVRLCSGTP